jgi:hypothetical protein
MNPWLPDESISHKSGAAGLMPLLSSSARAHCSAGVQVARRNEVAGLVANAQSCMAPFEMFVRRRAETSWP